MDSLLSEFRTSLGGAIAAVALCHILGMPRGDGPDLAYALAGFLACAGLVRAARRPGKVF